MPLSRPTLYGGGPVAALEDIIAPDRVFALPRNEVGGVVTLTSGETHLTYFTSLASGTATAFRTVTGSTAAATVTLCKVGLYRVEVDGSLTLLSDVANDATMWTAANTAYTKSIPTPFSIFQGQRYALATLFVGTTAPTLLSSATAAAFQTGLGVVDQTAPVRAGKKASQTDLTATLSTFIAALGRVYGEVLYTPAGTY